MAKLLETRLPVAIGEIYPETFNRLVRVLELSLNRVDIDATLSVSQSEQEQNKFGAGDVIWNLTTSQLQLWTGTKWVNIYGGEQSGVEGVSGLGKLSVSTNGSISVNIL
tara:strand:+ start:31 stop:357 length:327 start_codon:yes stop_codon:yes gene_type:complete